MSHLLRVPRSSRSDVGQGPSCFKLERRLIIHRQEGHEAGQQTGLYDLLQRGVTFLRKQLPEKSHYRRSHFAASERHVIEIRFPTLGLPGCLAASGLGLFAVGVHVFNDVFNGQRRHLQDRSPRS